MTNVINFQQQAEEMKGLSVLQLHDLFSEIEEVVYMYQNEYLGIVGMPSFLGFRHLISIEVLRKYTENQLFNKPTILDEFGLAWADDWDDFLNGGVTIICREGAFIWDVVGEDFMWIGALRNTVASRSVRINESFGICFGEEEIILEEWDEYQLEDQYEHFYDDGKLDMLVIKEEGKAPFVVPDNPQLLTKGYKDLALIGGSFDGEQQSSS